MRAGRGLEVLAAGRGLVEVFVAGCGLGVFAERLLAGILSLPVGGFFLVGRVSALTSNMGVVTKVNVLSG